MEELNDHPLKTSDLLSIKPWSIALSTIQDKSVSTHLSIRIHDLTRQSLGVTLLQLACPNKAGHLGIPHALDLVSNLKAVELAGKGGNLVRVDLALDELDVAEDGVDLGSGGVARGEVVGVLDGALEDTLVLLDGVLGRLLRLFGALAVGLGLLLCLLGSLLIGLLLEAGLLGGLLLGGLPLEPLLVLGGVGLLPEPLDALVALHAVVDHIAQAGVVLDLSLLAGVGVLALLVALLVAVLVVIGHVLVQVLERPPAVKVVPEVVEVLDLLLGGVGVAELRHGLCLGEAALGLEDLAPGLVVVDFGALQLLLGRGLDLSALVDGVVLTALDGVKQNLGRLLDALEEVVIVAAAGRGLLIGVVLEDLLAVGALDLLLGGLVTVLGDTQDRVVVLLLCADVLSAARSLFKKGGAVSYLPVLGFTLKHHRVLRLTDLARVLLLDVLGTLLGLDAVILGEGALVAGAAGVSEEVRANGLDRALGRGSDLADGLEVLVSGPSFWEDGQGSRDERSVRHLVEFACGGGDDDGRVDCESQKLFLSFS